MSRERVREWLPIESIPMQKLFILWAITDTETGNWSMWIGAKMPGYKDDPPYFTGRDGRQMQTYETHPTHWMPLPAPPQAKEPSHD